MYILYIYIYIYIYIFIYVYFIYIYTYIYKFTSKCHSQTIRLSHPQSGDSQGQETILAPPADKQTCNYDTECSNHHPSL